jgi:hypothetical protein
MIDNITQTTLRGDVSLDSVFPPLSTVTSEKNEVDRLRRRHQLFTKFAPLWDFYLQAYEGGADFAQRCNLFRHVRENEKDFDDRVERIHNMNYCEILVDFYTNFIFSEVIERNGGSSADFYAEFTRNVDLKKTPVDRFMRNVCDDLQIFGMVYGLVDAPAMDLTSGVITKYDLQINKVRPYWVLIKPEEVIDWVTDELDNYTYVKRFQMTTEAVGLSIVELEKYTEFTPDQIVISKVKRTEAGKAEIVSQVSFPNSMGKVPIVCKRFKESKRDKVMGLSYLRDFAGNNREILNLTSLLQEFLYRQAFNLLAREVDSTIPLRDQEDGVIGTANVMEVPKGAAMPEYISPPVDPAKFIMEERGRIKNEMFARASQDAMQELFNGESKSGFSQAQSFSKTAPFIATRADTLEDFENDMMQLTMERMNKQWDGKIQYKDRYEMTNLTDFLAQLQTLVRDFQMPSEAFVKEQLKRGVRSFDGKLTAELLAQVEKQIESMNFTEWMEVQKTALIGPPKDTSSEPLKANGGSQKTPTMAEVTQEAKASTSATKKPQPDKKSN